MVYNTKHILARYLAQMILVDEDLRSFLPRTDDKYLELAAHVQRYANRLKEDTNYGDHAEYAQFMADCPRYMALFLCREPLRVRRQRGYASRNEVARPSAIGLGGRAQLLVPAILHPPTSKFHAAALAQKISGMSLDKWTALGNFLRYRPAVESLALEASMGLALRLPGNKAGTLMRLIAGTTSPALNSHGLERTVTYDITWELATVLKKVWGRVEEGDMVSGAALTPDGLKNKSIKEMLVINGCAETAQVTTCEEYVKEHWKSALPLLDALDMSAWGAKPLGESHSPRARVMC